MRGQQCRVAWRCSRPRWRRERFGRLPTPSLRNVTSVNVPAASLVQPDKTFVPLADAAAKFASQGIAKDKDVICYCGGRYFGDR